ncbi:MAG: hypothetical protein ACHREM_25655 [Polyangiales bacterium]
MSERPSDVVSTVLKALGGIVALVFAVAVTMVIFIIIWQTAPIAQQVTVTNAAPVFVKGVKVTIGSAHVDVPDMRPGTEYRTTLDVYRPHKSWATGSWNDGAGTKYANCGYIDASHVHVEVTISGRSGESIVCKHTFIPDG